MRIVQVGETNAMLTVRRSAIAGLMLMLAGLASTASAGDEPPKIAKPRPADTPPPAPQTLPPASLDSSLAIEGEDIKAKKVETRLSVDVHVNDSGPYRFIVDSGADTSVVGVKIAKALELPLGTPAILNGMTSRSVIDRVKVAKLSLGSSTIHNLDLPALREDDLGGDGLIGIDALVQQRLMMDFEKRIIKVEDASVPIKYSPDDIVIVAKRRRGQLILTRVRAGQISLDAVIDTGSEISIGNSALRDKLIRHGRDKFTTIEAIGVTGATAELQIATISELKLGPVTLTDVPVAFADVPPFKVFGLANEPALLLGTDLLETFRRVSLDFRARKVRFQLRHCGIEGVTISTSPSGNFTRLSSNGEMDVCGR